MEMIPEGLVIKQEIKEEDEVCFELILSDQNDSLEGVKEENVSNETENCLDMEGQSCFVADGIKEENEINQEDSYDSELNENMEFKQEEINCDWFEPPLNEPDPLALPETQGTSEAPYCKAAESSSSTITDGTSLPPREEETISKELQLIASDKESQSNKEDQLHPAVDLEPTSSNRDTRQTLPPVKAVHQTPSDENKGGHQNLHSSAAFDQPTQDEEGCYTTKVKTITGNVAGKLKRNYCKYCCTMQSKIGRHMASKHKDIPEVKLYLKASNTDKKEQMKHRREICKLIINQSNKSYNDNISKNEDLGKRIVVKKTKEAATIETHVTCSACGGLLSKKHFASHIPNCEKRQILLHMEHGVGKPIVEAISQEVQLITSENRSQSTEEENFHLADNVDPSPKRNTRQTLPLVKTVHQTKSNDHEVGHHNLHLNAAFDQPNLDEGGCCTNKDKTIKEKVARKLKRNYCKYCCTMQSKIGRHMASKHKDIPEVQLYHNATNTDKKKQITQRREICKHIINQSNKSYNDKISKNKELGKPIVVKKTKEGATIDSHVTCSTCGGLLSKSHFASHKRNCEKRQILLQMEHGVGKRLVVKKTKEDATIDSHVTCSTCGGLLSKSNFASHKRNCEKRQILLYMEHGVGKPLVAEVKGIRQELQLIASENRFQSKEEDEFHLADNVDQLPNRHTRQNLPLVKSVHQTPPDDHEDVSQAHKLSERVITLKPNEGEYGHQNLHLNAAFDQPTLDERGNGCKALNSADAVEPLIQDEEDCYTNKDKNIKEKMAGKLKKNYCKYCCTMQTKIGRHMASKHNDIPEVKLYLKASNTDKKKQTQQRRDICKLIINQSNKSYNDNISKNKELGKPIVVKKTKEEATINSHVTCSTCGGLLSKSNFASHKRNCEKMQILLHMQHGLFNPTVVEEETISQELQLITSENRSQSKKENDFHLADRDTRQTLPLVKAVHQATPDDHENDSRTLHRSEGVITLQRNEEENDPQNLHVSAAFDQPTLYEGGNGCEAINSADAVESRPQNEKQCYTNKNKTIKEKVAGKLKRNYCKYCCTMQTKIGRHMASKHKDIPEVQLYHKATNTDKKKQILQRRDICKHIINQSNKSYNDKISKNKELGKPIVVKKTKKNATIDSYVTCSTCGGLLSKSHFAKHKRYCEKRKILLLTEHDLSTPSVRVKRQQLKNKFKTSKTKR